MSAAEAIVDRVRRPEYTGENRCIPCTVVNLAIALALAEAIVLLAWPAGAATAVGLAGLALAISVGAIYLRGYLVPGTPWLTTRFLPDRVLAWFGKAVVEPGNPVAGQAESSIDVETALVEAGALEECEAGTDLCLTPAVRTECRRNIDALRDGPDRRREAVAVIYGLDSDEVSLRGNDGAWYARASHQLIGHWPSEAALLADLAAVGVLADRAEVWRDAGPAERGELLSGLRLFVESCPACGGDVQMGEGTVESCCRSVQVVRVACESCESTILEMEQPDR